MIKVPQLLADLTRLLKRLEEDLLDRIDEVAELKSNLQAEWKTARDANRTAETFETWVDQVITQAGVHWLLSCVFLRFIEDNKLVDRPWLGGTPESGTLALARDRHEAYFRANPLHSDREYLLASFREASTLPGLHTFFDEGHNPVFRLGISGDAAMAVRQFWQQVDPNTGALTHDFSDPTWNTRFLGDLYQDLSEAARKRYALLQTPEFVEEFILDRTLTPAIRDFGYSTARLIDPTCGSGHFLLGAFHRFVDEWQRAEPSRNRRDIAQKSLEAVAGVDLNPFAVAISRFRLLVAALLASDVHKLSEAPDFRIHVAIGDSLLHGKRFGFKATEEMFTPTEYARDTGLIHAYSSEDLPEVQRILGRQYHAVVGNPPYIVVKDTSLNAAYRAQYESCHMKYSLGAPFTERFFELALTGNDRPAGYVGMITANSFMKREFGRKLIEEVLPKLDLTHIIDTSGAYIPGHGTPTVIIFGRHRHPTDNAVRTVMGIKGESIAPSDPARGLVWRAILDQIDSCGSESNYLSVADLPRSALAEHPWTIGGGGAGDCLCLIEAAPRRLHEITDGVGLVGITGEDEYFVFDHERSLERLGISEHRSIAIGQLVRDFSAQHIRAIWPYDRTLKVFPISDISRGLLRLQWNYRTGLSARRRFGRPISELDLAWYEWRETYKSKIFAPMLLTYAEVSTHNHFALIDDGAVTNQTAPAIALGSGWTRKYAYGLLGLLNSSSVCFWLKQVCQSKGGGGINEGHRGEFWEFFFQFSSTKVGQLPIPDNLPTKSAAKVLILISELNRLPELILDSQMPGAADLMQYRSLYLSIRNQLISITEEIDWHVYSLYEITDGQELLSDSIEDIPPLAFGERAFEIALSRRIAAGKEQSTWFDRHSARPITELPSHWSDRYKRLISRRIETIECNRSVGLLERPEFKRRWNSGRWEDLKLAALRTWLLGRLESETHWPANRDTPPYITTTSRLADVVQRDAAFMQVAALYVGNPDFDVTLLVGDLVAAESVPFLPSHRYTDSGMRKRAQWDETWILQRRKDAGEDVGDIPVPPKYQSKDFLKTDFWQLRGGLDVPKERWVSYLGCQRGADPSLPIAWAGWDHLQLATALAAYYLEMKESEGWDAARLQPLLSGLLELVPWLEQWHNEVDQVYGERMGAYYRSFVSEEARSHGFTLDDLRAWKPAAVAVRRGRRKVS